MDAQKKAIPKHSNTILFAGGGTAGHVYPALAVADEMRKRLSDGLKVLFVGSRSSQDRHIIERAGYRFDWVPAIGMPRTLNVVWALFIWNLFRSIIRSLVIIRRFRPCFIFTTGGYASGPVALAGVLAGIPIILQEQNVLPGLTNRWIYRLSCMAFLASEESKQFFKGGRQVEIHETGNPVRYQLGTMTTEEAEQLIGLEKSTRILFVFGGSQGSLTINKVVAEALKLWSQERFFQVIWQTGPNGYDKVRAFITKDFEHVYLFSYIHEMPAAYALSDLVVCRAGALTLSELAMSGKPSILIPLPSAAMNHQMVNAELFERAGAARIIPENELTPERLKREVDEIMTSASVIDKMAQKARMLARPQAAVQIADLLITRFFPTVGEYN